MIRGSVGVLLVAALAIALVGATAFEKIEITKAQRVVNLAGSYAGEMIKISFVSNEDSVDHFTYLLPLEYDNKVSKIWFTKS